MTPITQSGILELQAYLESCSEDVRTLFERECSVMLECRACRSIFRSFVNFFSHKRGFCRSETYEMKTGNSSPSHKKVVLRRTNVAKHVFKKIGVSEIVGINDDPSASLYVHTLPSHQREIVAIVDSDGTSKVCLPSIAYDDSDIPPDRVLLLRPQANPARYRGMNLRLRLKNDITRHISVEEVECIERLLRYFPDVVEPSVCRCLHSSCSGIKPFSCTQALAYHMSVKHTVREKESSAIPCLLCPKKFITMAPFYVHMKRKHARVKLEHLASRRRKFDESMIRRKNKRMGEKSTEQVCYIPLRSRSLSPVSDEEHHSSKSPNCDAEEVIGNEALEEESVMKDMEAVEFKERTPFVGVSCSNISSTKQQDLSSVKVGGEDTQNNFASKETGEEDKPYSAISLRKRRKRKIPARYRDEEFETYVSDCSRASSKLQHVFATKSSSQTPEESRTPSITRSDAVASDVSEVIRHLVSTVSDLLSRETSSPQHTSLRSKSSRLRRRPDWMDNEDFVIVDERKNRREIAADHPSPRVYNTSESNSHSSIKSAENEFDRGSTSTFTLPLETSSTAVPRMRRSPANFLDCVGNLSNRRKQNLNAIEDVEDNVTILSKNGKPSKVNDLAMVPVYLSNAQKQLFFSSLKQVHPDEPDGKHICSQCNEVVPNLKEGRRHMVTHIRVMRLRCSLCGAGSFFCTDLRVHLMEGYCEKLHRAPSGIVDPDRLPCMTKEQADSLSELADPINPGRVMYTSGQIVSAKSRIPYYPDPVIEERILGPGRVFCRSTPTRTKRT